MSTHQHEAWQLQESAQGGMYCAACGETVSTAQEELDKHYCPRCKHPWTYHSETGCSMPVTPGTHLPITRSSDPRERCNCKESKS